MVVGPCPCSVRAYFKHYICRGMLCWMLDGCNPVTPLLELNYYVMVKKWRPQPRGVSKKKKKSSHQLRVHYIQELEQGLQKIAARQRKHLPDGMNSSFFEG